MEKLYLVVDNNSGEVFGETNSIGEANQWRIYEETTNGNSHARIIINKHFGSEYDC